MNELKDCSICGAEHIAKKGAYDHEMTVIAEPIKFDRIKLRSILLRAWVTGWNWDIEENKRKKHWNGVPSDVDREVAKMIQNYVYETNRCVDKLPMANWQCNLIEEHDGLHEATDHNRNDPVMNDEVAVIRWERTEDGTKVSDMMDRSAGVSD